MEVVKKAQQKDIGLTPNDIFVYPTLQALSSKVSTMSSSKDDQDPAAQLPDLMQDASLLRSCANQCNVEESAIEDILPCSYDQACMATECHNNGAFIVQATFELPKGGERIWKPAFEAVYRKTAIYRTAYCQIGHGVYQVVLNKAQEWEYFDCKLEDFVAREAYRRFHYGELPSRFAVVTAGDRQVLVWTRVSASYDFRVGADSPSRLMLQRTRTRLGSSSSSFRKPPTICQLTKRLLRPLSSNSTFHSSSQLRPRA